MAVYRTIQLSFWTDSKVDDEFTPEDKYFYLYLLTNPHTNICGCYEIGERQFCRETGYNSETISRLISRFQNVHNVIRYDPKTKEVLILNWHKYNWTKSEDLKSNVRKVAATIKSDAFRDYVFSLVNASSDTVPTPSPHPVGTSVTDTVTDTVSVSVKEGGAGGNKSTHENDIKNLFGYNAFLEEAVNDWIAYKKEKKKPYKPVGLKSLLSTIQNRVTEYGEDAVVDIIRESMGSNYEGILWDKLAHKTRNGAREKSSNIFLEMYKEEYGQITNNENPFGS